MSVSNFQITYIMKTYILSIIPQIKRFSKKLDDIALLTDQHWVVLDDISNKKTVYIFRNSGQLLIAKDGIVEKAKWEYLGHNSLLIDLGDKSFLLKHGFFDENILALKMDSKDEYAILVNENKTGLNTIEQIDDFLKSKYLIKGTTEELPELTHKIFFLQKGYSLILGRYEEYLVEFSDKRKFLIYKRHRGVYVLLDNTEYSFENELQCIGFLMNYKRKKIIQLPEG